MTREQASIEVTDRPENVAELADLIESLTVFDYGEDGEGYNKAADAMWKAALAAFNYAARRVGATGFQGSWAALRFYGAALNIDGPFIVLQAHDALYPQYDLPGRLAEFLREQRGWLREQAREKLAAYEAEPTHSFTDEDGTTREVPAAHPNVVAHWRRLAEDGAR